MKKKYIGPDIVLGQLCEMDVPFAGNARMSVQQHLYRHLYDILRMHFIKRIRREMHRQR